MAEVFTIAERTRKPVNIYGQGFQLANPTLSQMSDMQMRLRDAGSETLSVFGEFLKTMGLPGEVVDQMEVEHASSLVEYLCGAKKN